MTMTGLVESARPHGGELVERSATAAQKDELLARAGSLPSINVSSRTVSDLEMLAIGAYSPLTGFMNRAEYRSVVNSMRLPNGLAWTIPVTLAVSRDEAASLPASGEIALNDASGQVIAVLELTEKYGYDPREEALKVYRTEDGAHPGVDAVYQQGDVLLAGPVAVLTALNHDDFPGYRLTPRQTRALFLEKGWGTVVGFQTRNPVHRAHEYIQKCALELVDGLLLHPLVGETKSDDIPADVRMRCYEVLLEGYYPRDRVVLAVNPAAMRYAGPREAIFHAIVRKNYGCSHFIVGRDHAGVGDYYGTYDAQHIFGEFSRAELDITPFFFDHTFFCRRCAGMASVKTCPHDSDSRVNLSGTQLREMLRSGQQPPEEFTRPEVAQVLIAAMQGP